MLGIVVHGDPEFHRRGALAQAIGKRPDRQRLLASVDLACTICAETAPGAQPDQQKRLIEAHAQLVRFGREIPTANFDPGLAVIEIGGLLARAALPRQSVDQAAR